jgi:hypothetical protein
MSRTRRVSASIVATGVLVPALALVTGRAQIDSAVETERAASTSAPWTPPRTAWGDPDLSGVWNYATMTPLERPRELADHEVLTEDEAAAYERRTVERQGATNNTAGPDWWDPGTRHLSNRRTALIVDPPTGRLPALTGEAQARAAERVRANRERGPADGPEDLGLNVRCLLWTTAGPPMMPGVYNNNVRFVQTPRYTVIFNEMIHDARIVPMDGRPHGMIRQWMGDSRGRWDGATLVVDTINFTSKSNFRGSGEQLHLVERFTRVDANTIEYRFTAEDPATWTTRWTALIAMSRTDEPMYEYACHEGNYLSLEGIFRGARAQEREGK